MKLDLPNGVSIEKFRRNRPCPSCGEAMFVYYDHCTGDRDECGAALWPVPQILLDHLHRTCEECRHSWMEYGVNINPSKVIIVYDQAFEVPDTPAPAGAGSEPQPEGGLAVEGDSLLPEWSDGGLPERDEKERVEAPPEGNSGGVLDHVPAGQEEEPGAILPTPGSN